jgi:group II intron reverse transcriptase/maturase
MQSADTLLNVIRDRGRRGLPLERAYRLLFNPHLYLLAYGRIYRNAGAMTKGVTEETVDAMSLAKIHRIIEAVRYERYRWKPVRRTHIPKRNGKKRPLGIPTWSDKLLQEVLRLILDAYFEPQFSDYSHGFRPKRGCHTALMTIRRTWKGTKWFIEGDIKGCFDSIDHTILLSILREKIHDNRFLRLIENLLKAGYLENWRYHPSLSGTPQGGILSPLLSNLYLDRLDQYVGQTLLEEYNRGETRRRNLDYERLRGQAKYYRHVGKSEKAKELGKQMRQLPRYDVSDPDYRRLHYVRYADDFLLGFAGPKVEADAIKAKLRSFLQDRLKLELSEEKTLITHAQTEMARFLGYEIVSQHEDTKRDRWNCRSTNGVVALRVPAKAVLERFKLYTRKGKPIHRPELQSESDFDIVSLYGAEYRGWVNYYLLATNIYWLNRLRWAMEQSLLRTLAGKYKSSVMKMARKYKSTVQTPEGPRRCMEVRVEREGKEPLAARFGGIPLKRQERAVLRDRTTLRYGPRRAELIQRLLADHCELCQSKENVEVHHIRKLADLKVKGRKEKPTWVKIMATRRRKTLVVCRNCHRAIQYGKPLKQQSRKK